MSEHVSTATAGTYVVGDRPEEWMEFFETRRWSDGLPVVPPTPDRVETFVIASGRHRDELLGKMPPAWGEVTVEKIAVNAVMAGARPEFMPVLIAAVEAALRPEFNLYGIQATTNPVAPALVVSGPAATCLKVSGGYGCLGPGYRANATIGRAFRLLLLNVGGAKPGVLDRATVGQAAKYTFAFAENEARCPWPTFGRSRGLAGGQSGITIVGISCLINALDDISNTADDLLATLAQCMTAHGTNTMQLGGEVVLLLCPEHAEILARDGLGRQEIQQELYRRAVTPAAWFTEPHLRMLRAKRSRYPAAVQTEEIHALDSPESLLIIVAGGDGPHSVIAPTFGDTSAITCPIEPGVAA
ncbi:MAG: hypothetical protein HYY95_25570 [Candidatus Rokubacteria bacterium]|nr:hypothetical protein [Candidatus Rokubacteria bacterium]